MIYDYIIIGAGISGLYMANYLHQQGKSVCILEQKMRKGGRIKTVKNGDLIYEAGAFRFSTQHKHLLKLIRQFELDQYIEQLPATNGKTIKYFLRNGTNTYHTPVVKNLSSENILSSLTKKNKTYLENNNLSTIISNEYDNETSKFINDSGGYDNSFHNANGLILLKQKKLHNSPFYRLSCGFSKIIDQLAIPSIESKIHYTKKLLDVSSHGPNGVRITTKDLKMNKIQRYQGKKIIVTIPKENLLEIPFFRKNIRNLESVSSSSYIRIFAQYPKSKSTGKVWFHKYGYTITDTSIRKIIPENYDRGLCQFYSDWKHADILRNVVTSGKIKQFVETTLKRIFPNESIPKPTYFNVHYWQHGNHFWLPTFNSEKISQDMLNPLENIYFVGESYSNNHQAWIEGALETCEALIAIFELKSKTKSLKKTKPKSLKKISLKEVEKHNTNKSAWTVYNNKVYDITKFIKLKSHPGGDGAIRVAMGKDISEIFNSIGHSKYAINLLEKLCIGELKKTTTK